MQSHLQVKNPMAMAVVLMLATFIGLFGETALNMALTDIMADFDVKPGIAQWLTTGYLLVLAILVPLSAYLVRWFTTRQLITSALIISAVGAIVAAIAPSFEFLLVGRIIQGIGTGIFLPLMFSVVLIIFPMEKRGAVMGIVGLVVTAGPALGPTIAGLIISAASWHYIFWIMLVLYVILLFVSISKVENVAEITKPKIDVASLLLSTIGFGGIVFALATLAEESFGEVIVWLPLVVGVIALVLFTTRQFKMEHPMINLRVFSFPMFALGTVLMFATLFMILSVAILIPMYLKTVLGYTAIGAGLIMLPGNVLNIIMSPIVGTSFDKVGARKYTRIGFAMIVIAAILLLITISATTSVWQVVVILCIFFVGVSMTIMPAQTNAMNALSFKLYADGSAAMNTLTQVAGAAGTAVAITMFTVGQDNYAIDKGFENADALMKNSMVDIPAMLANGVNHAFIVVLIVAIIGLIGSFFVKNSTQAK